jgi:hypothetical protein
MPDTRLPLGMSEEGQKYYNYYYNMFMSNPTGALNFTMPDNAEARAAAQKAAEQVIADNPIHTRSYSYGGKEYQVPLDSKTAQANGSMSAVTSAKAFLRKLSTYISREQQDAAKTASQLGSGSLDKKANSDVNYWGRTANIPSPELLTSDPSVAGQTLTMLYNQKIAAGNDPAKVNQIAESNNQIQQLLKSKMESDPTFRAVALYVYYSGVKFHSTEEEAAKEKCLKAYKPIYDNWIASKKPMLSDGVKETKKKAQEATTSTYEQKTPQMYQ